MMTRSKNMFFLPFVLFVSFSTAHANVKSKALTYSVEWDSENDIFSLVEGTSDKGVAFGNYTNSVKENGWCTLEIKTFPVQPDDLQAFAAGFLEGATSREIVYDYWRNTVQGYCKGKEKICARVKEYLKENQKWVKEMVKTHAGNDPYWHQVHLFYRQLEGLVDGYNVKPEHKISYDDFYWMNVFGDLEDLEQVFASEYFNETEVPGHVTGSGSCSALIKLLPGNEDLYAAHDTWNSYQSMNRFLKRYNFAYHRTKDFKSGLVPGHSISFSSYPGVIYSGDDFNLIASSGLLTMETTIGNGNPALWKYVKPYGQILEGARATVANRLATSGKEWTSYFAQKNSGTYNNQWMVVDYKLFKPKQKVLKPGLLWVLEQLPGHTHSADVTGVLKKQGYWPSYNTPYFPDIFKMSGAPKMVKKYGNWFSYDKTPRALIFKRDQGKIHDVNSMTKMMRYNNFKHDPLSKCNCTPPYSAENAISARNDLNPKDGKYPFGALGHRSHGGTDMKLTSSSLMLKDQFIAIGGPTYDDLPPFQWSKTDFGKDTPHYGQPDKWEFKPVTAQWYTKPQKPSH